MADFEIKNGVAIIPEGTKKIGDNAFCGCSGLTSVTIGNSVTSIGENAFCGCSGLTSVTIGNSVTSIGENAFCGCSGLTSVHISDIAAWCNIEFEFGSNPLSYAHHLYLNGEEVKDLVIPNSVTSIGENAFENCDGLTSVIIPNSVTSIGKSAFYGCTGLKSVTMPNKVLKINESAFAGCTSLACITIPTPPKNKGVCKIAERVFEDCCGLKSITIPDKVTTIGRCAFAGCTGLVNITIPSSVTEIGDGAFYGCTGLQTVTIIGNSLEKIGRCAFNGCTNLQVLNIPLSVTEIGRYAFEGCANISIPAGVNVECPSTYRHPYTTTIDRRLAQDLKNLYNNGNGIGEMQGAKALNGIIATQPGQTSFATKAIPSYGGGKRGAKTVMVMLNPGEDVAKANANLKRDLCKRGMKDLLDIDAYNEFNVHYGNWDKNRQDAFDLKQAFFLRDWPDTGIDLPNGLCANSSLDDKLVAKERVLDDKQQLELIPYASCKFEKFNSGLINRVFPYVETLLEEIFSTDRKYVIFCSAIFEEVFKAYNGYNKQQNRNINVKSTHHDTQLPGLSKKVSCCILDINYYGQNKKAVIANTFPRRDITYAYDLMAAYGEFCYNCLLKHLP